ncbi:MAG: LysE family transporter [Microscillaceae bacterium]|nr:LysE family transporter [Microscillaceae bacterium]
MLLVLIYGILYGLVLSMLIGPVFFALIRTSIDKGFRSGAFLALGIALSDALAAFAVYSSIAQFSSHPIFQTYLGFVGGFLMLGFGLAPFVKNVTQKKFLPAHPISPRTRGLRFVLEGILLNLLNPFVYIFWIGVVSQITVATSYTSRQHLMFFIGTIGTVLATDLVKAYVAQKITKYLTAQVIGKIDKIAGIALTGYGFRLLFFALYGY